MKRLLLVALFTLLSPVQGPGQDQRVTVRLFWLHPPAAIRLVPEKAPMELKTCSPCSVERFDLPVRLRAVGDSIQLGSPGETRQAVEINNPITIEPGSGPSFAVRYPLEVRASQDLLQLTIRIPLEDYVAAVLAGESSNFSSQESLKAMAVAVRTYAVHFRGRHAQEGFDFCDTTHCQDFRLHGMSERLRQASAATAGELLWYEGMPAATFYHHHCGGITEAGHELWSDLNVPYLKQHSDNFCLSHGPAEWHAEINRRDFGPVLASLGISSPGADSLVRSLRVVGRTPSGRVRQLRLDDGVEVSAPQFRLAVGRTLGWGLIRSDLYDVRQKGDRFVFHGRGHGHGVGLCQAGAARMGEEGRSYGEILSFYYPGTTLGLTARGISWQAIAGEQIEILTTQPEEDRFLVPSAERQFRELEQLTGWRFESRIRIQSYPSLDAYRNATGQPGWVAASSRGHTIRLQPPALLRSRGVLESTLRHELLHQLVESYAGPTAPLWLREGIVLVLSGAAQPARAGVDFPDPASLERALTGPQNEDELRRAYAAARACAQELIERHGRDRVLGWVQSQLPPPLQARPCRALQGSDQGNQ